MEFMKLLKFSIGAAVAALLAGSATVTQAQDVGNGTYTFESTDGNTAFDGSTVTFLNDNLVSWDMTDSVAQSLYYPGAGSWYTTTLPLTPANSMSGVQFDTLNDVNTYQFDGVLAPNEWAFHILSDTLDVNYYDYFEAGNNVDTSGSSLGSLYDGFGDPHGNWVLNSVPDATDTVGLMAGALMILGTCKSCLRGRAASRR
jgi:hypothetical protein